MKFSAIEVGTNSYGTPTFNVVDERGDLVVWDGFAIIVVGKSTAEEIANRMTHGAKVSSFYEDSDPYAYGGELHQEYGDSWLYADCHGAW